MLKFTRHQVSSKLNYLEMYNVYTLRQVTSKQQVSQQIVSLVFSIF